MGGGYEGGCGLVKFGGASVVGLGGEGAVKR